ncbi:MAG: hypothetical protein ACK41T_01430 [Pseudobdellovibrio sp.]
MKTLEKNSTPSDVSLSSHKTITGKKLLLPFLFFFLLILIISTSFTQKIHAQSSSSDRPWLLSKGSAAREAKRFNLYDWLEEKNRNKVMDMWLSINTPSPYEFMLGGSFNQFNTQNEIASLDSKNKSYQLEASAYALLVGLTGEYENNTEERFHDMTGIFNLRLFGHTIQGTNLTAHYGLRTRKDNSGQYRLNQQFAAASFQLYLMKYFGLTSHYRYFFPFEESFYGDTKSDLQSYGAFIDFASLRIMGSYFYERQNSKKNNVEQRILKKGTKISLQLFF